jgi:hypothetical protein
MLLVVLTALFSIPLILPYFHQGYFPTNDGEWAVVRLADMYRELKDHQFPARYSGNLNSGFGYPLFEFAYPLPYYLGIPFHFVHISFVESIKLLFLVSVPLSFLGMFLVSRLLWKNDKIALLSSILYLYYPYRLVDLYVRGSLGESLSLVLFPLIIYGILKFSQNRNVFAILLSGISFGALIMTHNIMALEFLPIILLVMAITLYNTKKGKIALVLQYLSVLLIGFGISAFFWIPALAEKKLVALSVIPIDNILLYFVNPMQLIYSPWAFGGNSISYQLGIVQLFILVCLLFILLRKNGTKTANVQRTLALGILILLILYILLLFPFTVSLWKTVPLMSDITYPWTLLAPIGFLIALLSGRVFLTFSNKFFWIVIALVAIIYSVQFAHPSSYVDRGDGYYLTNDATTTSSDEYMPIWVKDKPQQRVYTKFVLPNSKGSVTQAAATSKSFSATVSVPSNSQLLINTIYYPGWQISVDNKITNISYANPQGLMTIMVPKGTHAIQGVFKETSLRLVTDVISLITFIIVVVMTVVLLVRRKLHLKHN